MNRIGRVAALLMIASLAFASVVSGSPLGHAVAQSDRPEGVPAAAQKATVSGYEDGDKFKVEINGKTETVLLISADAPEKGECFASESSRQLKKYLPEGSAVYLERDETDRDGKDRLLRYVWVPKEERKATLIDERMIATGNSTFKSRDDNTKYDARLKKAEQKAKGEKRGLWKKCGGGHVEVTSAPEPTDVPKPGSKEAPAAVGTQLEADGRAVTVTDYLFSYDYGFGQPKGGYVFLVIYVEIANVGDGNNDYEEADFRGINAETDAEYDSTFVFSDQPLGSGDLSEGEFVSGQVVLEVQDAPYTLLVQFDPSLLGGSEVYWLIPR